MNKKRYFKFNTAAENLDLATALTKIRQIVNQTAYITNILHSNLPQLINSCHCGAIDNEENIIVLFANSNSSFYKINQLIPDIEDVLFRNHISYDKIIIKIRPENVQQINQIRPKKKLTQSQKDGLLKIAQQINRLDLIRNIDCNTENDSTLIDNDIDIHL